MMFVRIAKIQKIQKNLHCIGFIIIFARQFNFLLLIMNKTRFLFSFLFLTILFGFLFPTTVFAQYDDFFRDKKNENRDVISPATWTITNQGIGQSAPLEGGLLVLMAAGAGYAALRRKRKNNSQNISLILAFVMLLGLTQCKKKIETVSNNTYNSVYITLNVGDGSKASVITSFEDPETGETYAKVTFDENDTIYVGNNGAYCGCLIYDGSQFSGTITPTSDDYTDYLHFYFMGNKVPSAKPVANSTTTFSVNITDQTSKYPVISYGRSTNLYSSAQTSYQTTLLNKCAIVKFNITNDNIPAGNAVSISGMNNIVTVDFTTNIGGTNVNPYTYDMYGEGDIKLHPEGENGAHERWAILLPQAAVSAAEASGPGSFTMQSFAVPAINVNDYKPNGIDITLYVPTPGAFCINKNGNQVVFAPGNLQCTRTGETWAAGYTWSFMPNQTDFSPTSNTNGVGSDCENFSTISHFGWGTSGYHDTNDDYNVYYQPYSTTKTIVNETYNVRGYGPSMNMTYVNLTDGSANYDWGVYHDIYNPVTDHTDVAGTWRTPASSDITFILGPNVTDTPVYYGNKPNTRRSATVNGVPNARFAKAFLFGTIHGLIIFPDGYVHPDGVSGPDYINDMTTAAAWEANQYSSSDWNAMQTAGAVFLPAAGCRETYDSGEVGIHSVSKSIQCWYWTSTYAKDDPERAKNLRVAADNMYTNSGTNRFRGCSVRLVRDIPTSK